MKYQVTIPVCVFVVVDVEADNEDEAIDAAVPASTRMARVVSRVDMGNG